MYIIERVDITKHDGWNFVRNYLLNIKQVSDIDNCGMGYPIHCDQDDWCCVEWNEEYDGC